MYACTEGRKKKFLERKLNAVFNEEVTIAFFAVICFMNAANAEENLFL